MKPKYNLFYKGMIALLAGAVFFTSCKHDAADMTFNSANNTTEAVNSTNATTSALATTGLILDNNFDGSSPFTGFTLANHQYCCDYSITQVASPDGSAGKSLKFDLRSTDAIVSSSKRAEIQLAGTDAPVTSERWYGLRYWLQKYDSDNGAESILQWHDVDGTTPPLSIQVASGRMRIMQSFTSGNTPTDIGATVTGKWINIVMHVKWTTGTSGLLEVWRDGTKVVSKSNVRTNSNGGSYLKLGINKWSWAPGGGSSSTTQRVFYIDNFKMGNETASYASVDPSTASSGTDGGTTTTNLNPVVSAGSGQAITLPTSSVTLSGTASDPDGTIASYSWTKVSGGSATIVTPSTASTVISGLVAGSYVFNLKVTDNKGATANSNVGVTVYGTTSGSTGSTGPRANLILDNNFDGSAFTGFTLANQQYCCSYSITQVTAPDGGASGKSLRYDLRSSDPIVSSSKRAEIQLSGTDAPQTSERWYGLRYWLEKYDADNGAESILQWHDVDGTTPPLSLQVAGGRMNICQSFTSGNTHYDLGQTTTGKWISIVIHVKWTTGNTGVLEVWKDGTKMVSKVNVRTNSNGGSYMKIGINKWSWAPGGGSSSTTQRIFYIDDFRMGNDNATYNDVAP